MDASASFPRFIARAPWWGADLQTLRNVLRGPVLRELRGAVLRGDAAARSERLVLPLGDGSGDRIAALLERPAEPRENAPGVALIHGLGGDETSAYMQASAAQLLAQGFAVLRLNLRGAGPSRPLCSEQYHAGRTADLDAALRGLPDDATRDGLVLVGYSLGGNMLLKFLAEYGHEVPALRGAVSISAPIDLAHAARRILEPRNWLYHRHLLAGMKREALAADSISERERRIVAELRSIVDFDEHIVAPRNGYASAEDYYAKNHARQFLAGIEVDTLLIHGLDDPWIPAEAYTGFDWARNPRLVPLLAPSGGHLGFHARGSRIPWHDRCLLHFLTRIAGADSPGSRLPEPGFA